MIPILLALFLTVLVLASWHVGKLIERTFAAESWAARTGRRLTYTWVAFEILRNLVLPLVKAVLL